MVLRRHKNSSCFLICFCLISTCSAQTLSGQIDMVVRKSPAEVRLDQNAEESIEPGSGFHIGFFGGVSLPMGKFAEVSDKASGFSITGWTVGVDGLVELDPHVDWISSLNLSVNRTDMGSLVTAPNIHVSSTSWSNVWLLTGLRVNGPVVPGSPLKLFAQGQVGFLFGTSPAVNLDWGSGYSNQGSSSSQALGYSIGAGLAIENFSVCVRYVGGTPSYNFTATGSGGKVSGAFEQQTSCIEIAAGVGF